MTTRSGDAGGIEQLPRRGEVVERGLAAETRAAARQASIASAPPRIRGTARSAAAHAARSTRVARERVEPDEVAVVRRLEHGSAPRGRRHRAAATSACSTATVPTRDGELANPAAASASTSTATTSASAAGPPAPTSSTPTCVKPRA